MSIKFSQFFLGGTARAPTTMNVGDTFVGLRTSNGIVNNYQFNFPGIGINDAAGSPLLRWTPGSGTNVNYLSFTSASTTNAPLFASAGSDTNVNLNIGAQGSGYVQFTGTGAIAIPAGTSAQAPVTFVGGGIRYNTTTRYLDYWSTVSNSWVDLTSGSALSNLTFVTNTDETAFAPNSQPLSLLATGFATVTTTTGIVGSRILTGTSNEISISHGDGTTGNPTFSIPTTFIAPGTIAAVTSVSAPEYLLTGATDGVISILPQAHAGTYNFNMPTTAGTSGYVLTSAGGGSSPMTWTNLSSATVTSISGTANEITASASTGAVTLSIPNTFIAPGTIAAVTSISSPEYFLTGSGSGTISILPQAAAGTYNFNLPIAAGTSGYVLTSAGGGSSPMTWTNLSTATVTSISGTANEITASASTGAVTLSIPSTFIAPGSIQATTSSAAASFLLNGSGSGTVSILPQAAAGTYNFNLPITAGTSGYLLTSAGGAGSPMTWSNPASISVTSIAGTANEITASASTGAVTLSIPSTFIAPGSIAATTTVSGTTFNSSTLTASEAVFSDASKNLVSVATTGTGNVVLATSPTLVTPLLGTPTSGNLSNCTNYPGVIVWQTVQTSNFNASVGAGYPVNTTSIAITATLPASPSAGNVIIFTDYAGTFAVNNLTINPNGNKIYGSAANLAIENNREAIQLVYIDSTQGWINYGGVNTTTPPLTYSASYLLVAGGGGGGSGWGGGGGGGGLLTGTTTLTVGNTYNFVVGGSGTAGTSGGAGGNGGNSTGFSLTATGGGGGGGTSSAAGLSGGSGGGGAGNSGTAGGSGTGGQGSAGGIGFNGSVSTASGGGGGGATAVGVAGLSAVAGAGGAGTASSITGSPVTYAGGGGGGAGSGAAAGAGGAGGGGAGGADAVGTAGTANTGGGGGGGGGHTGVNQSGAAGGTGVVIVSVPTANYTGTTTGSPTITTSGSNTIMKFTASGSYTA
jgi:hypothetical protein